MRTPSSEALATYAMANPAVGEFGIVLAYSTELFGAVILPLMFRRSR